MKRLALVATMGMFVMAGCGENTQTQLAQNDVPAAAKESQSVPGEMIIKFKDSVGKSTQKTLHKSVGHPVLESFDEFGISRVQVPEGSTPQDIRNQYGDSVEYVEPNYKVMMDSIPNDTYFSGYQWNMQKIGMPAAWDKTQGSSNVVVGIIDSGIDASHAELSPSWSGYFKNVAGVQQTPFDDFGHGTAVAGVIAAKGNNGTGIAGVNWNGKVAVCKSSDSTGVSTVSNVIACISYFSSLKSQGVNVVAINESFGFVGESLSLKSAIQSTPTILHVTSAGNTGSNNDVAPKYPASYKLPNLISVAATTSVDTLTSFANYGRRTVSLSAPGESIVTTSPGGTYVMASGSSFSAPHVAGTIGLIAAMNPTMPVSGIRNLILNSGDTVASLTSTTLTGKRLNTASALACTNKPLFALSTIPSYVTTGLAGNYTMISTNCATAVSPITVTSSAQGKSFAVSVTDGMASFSYIPTSANDTLKFSSAAGTESVIINLPYVSTASIPAMTVGTAVSVQLTATGGTGPYTYTGALPFGLTLSATGKISGTPISSGTATANVTAIDTTGAYTAKPLTFTVASNVVTPPVVTPLAFATVGTMVLAKGVPTSIQVKVTGGTAPYTFSGTLPYGLTISTTGLITGKPAVTGIVAAAIKVVDAKGATLTKNYAFNSGIDKPLATTVFPTLKKGVPVSIQLVPSGNTGPYVYSGYAGAGLKLSATGLITGTPTTVGTGTAILTTTDVNKDIATKIVYYTVTL